MENNRPSIPTRQGHDAEAIAWGYAEHLKFTGYFKILNRGAFLMDPGNPVTDAASIVFRNWTTIGAELLITGNIQTQEDQVDMELRLFDPFKGELLVGKRYKDHQDIRNIVLMGK